MCKITVLLVTHEEPTDISSTFARGLERKSSARLSGCSYRMALLELVRESLEFFSFYGFDPSKGLYISEK